MGSTDDLTISKSSVTPAMLMNGLSGKAATIRIQTRIRVEKNVQAFRQAATRLMVKERNRSYVDFRTVREAAAAALA